MILNTNLGQVDIYAGQCTDLSIDRNTSKSCIELTTDFKPVSTSMRELINRATMEKLQADFDDNIGFYQSELGCQTLKEAMEKFNIAETYSYIQIYMCDSVCTARLTVVYLNAEMKTETAVYAEGDILDSNIEIGIDILDDISTVEQFVIDMVKENFVGMKAA